MKKNDVVKFKNPINENEAAARFLVLDEQIGKRVLVREITYNTPLQRTVIFNTDELCVEPIQKQYKY